MGIQSNTTGLCRFVVFSRVDVEVTAAILKSLHLQIMRERVGLLRSWTLSFAIEPYKLADDYHTGIRTGSDDRHRELSTVRQRPHEKLLALEAISQSSYRSTDLLRARHLVSRADAFGYSLLCQLDEQWT